MKNRNSLAGLMAMRRELPPAERRRELRTRAGVSLDDVARECGVSRECVRTWEMGTRYPNRDHIGRYLAVLKTLGDVA